MWRRTTQSIQIQGTSRDSIDVQRAEELYSLPKHVNTCSARTQHVPYLQFLLLLPPPSKLCLPAAALQVHSTYLSSDPSQPGNPFLATPKRLNRVLQKSQVWESGVSINQSRMAHQSVNQWARSGVGQPLTDKVIPTTVDSRWPKSFPRFSRVNVSLYKMHSWPILFSKQDTCVQGQLVERHSSMVHYDACSQICLVRKRRIGELQFATCTTSCHSLRAHHNESQSCRVAMTNRRCYGCPVPTGYKGCECDLQSEIKSKTSRTRQICQAWKASSFDRPSSQNRKGQRKEELLSCMRYGNNRHVRALYFGGSDDNHLIP